MIYVHVSYICLLKEYLPTPDEIRKLKAFTGEREQLGQPEKYMMMMMDCSSAKARLECMKYKHQFNSRMFELTQTAQKILSACDDVRNSLRLKKVLKTILKVGNQMNDGADNLGFSLDSLLKLQAAKAFDNKTTILDYVINLIHKNDQQCLDFPLELSHVETASRLPMEVMDNERSSLRKGLDECLRLMNTFKGSPEGIPMTPSGESSKISSPFDSFDSSSRVSRKISVESFFDKVCMFLIDVAVSV